MAGQFIHSFEDLEVYKLARDFSQKTSNFAGNPEAPSVNSSMISTNTVMKVISMELTGTG